MKSLPRRLLAALTLGTLLSLATAHAGVIRFNATIDGAQDGTNSASTGTAVLWYDATANTFDLTVTLLDFPNPLTNSHIHEGAPGVAGPVVVPFGAEADGYVRDGTTLTGTFLDIPYTGDVETLLTGGAYLNYHTAAFAAGEIRGRLLPEPVKLTALMDPSQETQVPAVVSDAYGAVQATYDPMTNMITTLVCLYNFTNTLTNSHIHEAAVGVSGLVTLGFGGAAVYTNSGTTYVQQFGPSDYPGSPVALLSEGAYVNAHSNIYGPGEIRGQLFVLNPSNAGRLVNVSARAHVGTGDDVLISGFFVQGGEPVRVLVTGRGPGLTGVTGALADPMLAVHDADGNLLFTNDDVAGAPFQALITGFTAVTFQAPEAGVLLVLPPGGFTGIVSGEGDTMGVGLAEAFEVSW